MKYLDDCDRTALEKEKRMERRAYEDAISAQNRQGQVGDCDGTMETHQANSQSDVAAHFVGEQQEEAAGGSVIPTSPHINDNEPGEDSDGHDNVPDATQDLTPQSQVNIDKDVSSSSRDRVGDLIPISPHVGSDNGDHASSHASSASTSRVAAAARSASVQTPTRNLRLAFGRADSSSKYDPPASEESDNYGSEDEAKDEEEIYEEECTSVSIDVVDYIVLDSDGENEAKSVYDEDEEVGLTEPAAEESASAPDLLFSPSLVKTRTVFDSKYTAAKNKWKTTPVLLTRSQARQRCTIMMNKRGLCEAILSKKMKNGRRASNKRPCDVDRGTYQVAEALRVPAMKVIRWYDNQGVHILATGGSAAQDRIVRRDQATAEQAEMMAPRIVKDYQTYMGGVDVHDQLRLQRYPLQMTHATRNITTTHIEFLKKLHLELIQLKRDDWTQMLRHRGMQPTPSKRRKRTTTHVPIQTDEWRKGNTNDTRKRRQRACKVCSVLKRAGEA
ncbi:uncharacterized protein IUM83_15839 [Phytophthora cinnamomi]|uniref:uncharacterized protein n=1 Tax=Phytophthora cinnamomi TaxID=4785 RepID=UPI00355AB931|nr:hypothetical protein IUM83_15839 [Phytophthora cinnamomi]